MRKLKITEIQRLSVETFRQFNKLPIVVLLDDIRSMNNVGSILRTADAFRLEAVLLCGITACPPHPDIHKTALGAEDSVCWEKITDPHEAVFRYIEKGYRICALEQAEGSLLLQDLNAQRGKGYVLILGNEVFGVKQSLIDLCDCCLEIPQFGTKHSLNVSVAAGMAIWQMAVPLLPSLAY
ncbi:tRNA/rRNA methyltransferase [Porphyromonas crevioricanis JCM 15906]|uniref:RNA methyltransferase n=2 Tax=Porphyromonas crevioricanis TaxID=393921 RepID=A0A2X4PIW3_9PORP|nr:RNA methyltransferase [Porphyromonas crevioricanis]KGN96932.1 RNA methyltransferase [Porphyromonas crevioricanis]SJZ91078.1 SpoU rRNA Methylase family protein [Porphyromonas crevioricanis]SQH73896.1 tRNA (guanosine(18)-2'-O)-methyltransferase [Porphyromonas crevioricanis]GAD06092.1 tRNA/rRNA methyltransferase [Porphyromonas crevioricanis JCM 15906]GAD07850.1 TRNA/rRNA methyltransferase [Porphyromonas crevioricanis JCM 13913]